MDEPAPTSVSDPWDPRATAFLYVAGSGAILLTLKPAALVALAFVAAALVLRLQLAARWFQLLRSLAPSLALFAIAVGLSAGFDAAWLAALRLVLLATAGLLFFFATPPEELGDALIASGVQPRIALLLEGTLRFVPVLGQLVGETRDGLASRGLRLDGLFLVRNGPLLLAPILVGALQLADDLAETIAARGLVNSSRTPLREYRFDKRDWLLVSLAVVFASTAAAAAFDRN